MVTIATAKLDRGSSSSPQITKAVLPANMPYIASSFPWRKIRISTEPSNCVTA
jgi:hypothetical protein